MAGSVVVLCTDRVGGTGMYDRAARLDPASYAEIARTYCFVTETPAVVLLSPQHQEKFGAHTVRFKKHGLCARRDEQLLRLMDPWGSSRAVFQMGGFMSALPEF